MSTNARYSYRSAAERSVCVALVLMLVLTAMARQGGASLRGQVTDELGDAVVGAVVTLAGSGGDKVATTNAQGRFLLTNIVPGKYRLRVNATGFAAYEDSDVDLSEARRDPLIV